MKIVLVLLSAVAVFTADPPDFPVPDNPDDGSTTASGDEGVDGISADELARLDVFDEEDIMQEGGSRFKRGLRDAQCEANVICGILGGSCIANDTVCSGWLVSEGCKGKSCKCCIPGSLEIKMKNFGQELQSLKEELTNSSLDQTMELKAMITNITNTNAGLKGQIQTFTNSKINASSNFESQLNGLTKVNAELKKKIDSIETDVSQLDGLTKFNAELKKKIDSIEADAPKQGCLKGTFWFPPSDQCFLYVPSRVNWATANSRCVAQGLVFAKPYDPVALRSYLVARYKYTDWMWLGAKGTGSYMRWQRDSHDIDNSAHFYYSSPSKSTSHCLAMMLHPSYLKSYYTNPYSTESCTSINTYLCEYVRK